MSSAARRTRPRTQGLTSTPGSAEAQLAFGMIQLGPTGWFIFNDNRPVAVADQQRGSFLVRDNPVPAPDARDADSRARAAALYAHLDL